MIEAVASPPTVQLLERSGSSRKRVVPYQTKKSRVMSPGRSQRTRRAISRRTIAPTAPEMDSYRNSGWKWVSTGVVPSGGQAQSGGPVDALDRDPPGEIGRGPVELLVEEVAPAGHRLHHEEAGRDAVGPGQEGLALPAHVDVGHDEAGDDPAVDAQAAVGRQDDRGQVVLVAVPLVDDVVEAAADQSRDGDDDHAVDQEAGVQPAAARLALDDHERRGEPEGVHDPVPVDGEGAERERDRIGRPVDHRRECSGGRPGAVAQPRGTEAAGRRHPSDDVHCSRPAPLRRALPPRVRATNPGRARSARRAGSRARPGSAPNAAWSDPKPSTDGPRPGGTVRCWDAYPGGVRYSRPHEPRVRLVDRGARARRRGRAGVPRVRTGARDRGREGRRTRPPRRRPPRRISTRSGPVQRGRPSQGPRPSARGPGARQRPAGIAVSDRPGWAAGAARSASRRRSRSPCGRRAAWPGSCEPPARGGPCRPPGS